ncbi:MAG: NADPH-dependent oxidoreductase [Ruoffia tabacinasalis]|uniref:NADPH-dependent oxidoreductase n=1 Tax=Ruoffia tabacinasalis TaxID=87458 RepID=A0A5R9DTI4_9LACT|nr:NADPH-dependent oxidoreductase [Ruoffia tabacinasalis]TLQ40130.1 NADPH-dependent oxidoreductase [Ruoffia tabacinasalis]
MQNYTTKHQLEHRTIRFFKNKPVDSDLRNKLFTIMNRTATSSGMQTYSVIRVTDQAKKDQIAEVCKQAYVAEAPELLIFVVDTFRMKQIAQEKGYNGESYRTMDIFFQGVADAYLAAQNLTTAIESYDLGAVYLGSILNDPQEIIDILELPELTFPMVGMLFGYPDDNPQLKPRMDLKYKVGENSYPYVADIITQLKDYDDEMSYYHDTRDKNCRSDTHTDHVVRKLSKPNPLRQKLLQDVEKQCFDLMVDE